MKKTVLFLSLVVALSSAHGMSSLRVLGAHVGNTARAGVTARGLASLLHSAEVSPRIKQLEEVHKRLGQQGDLLGLQSSAGIEERKKVCNEMLKLYHPDLFNVFGQQARDKASDITRELVLIRSELKGAEGKPFSWSQSRNNDSFSQSSRRSNYEYSDGKPFDEWDSNVFSGRVKRAAEWFFCVSCCASPLISDLARTSRLLKKDGSLAIDKIEEDRIERVCLFDMF